MKFTFIITSLFLFQNFLQAQQIGANSLYRNSLGYYNPAYTAAEYKVRGGFQLQRQWDGWEGSPVNYFGQYEHHLDSINSGIGFTVMREEVGFSIFQSAFVNYSYELKLTRKNKLSFGLSAGAVNTLFDPFWAIFDPNDPEVPGKAAQTKFTLNTGILLTINRFRFGLSALQLNQPNFALLNYKSKLHTVITFDYKWLLTRKINLEPSIFFITDGVFMSATGQLRANYDNKFWLMGGYRSEEAILIGAGAIIHKRYSVGYFLDIRQSKLSNSGTYYSHGVYLNYQIQRPKPLPYRITGTPDF